MIDDARPWDSAARAALCLIAAAHPASRILSIAAAVRANGIPDGLTGGLAGAAGWAMRSGDWAATAPAALALAANVACAASAALVIAVLLRPGKRAGIALATTSLAALALSLAHGAIGALPSASAVAALLLAFLLARKGAENAR